MSGALDLLLIFTIAVPRACRRRHIECSPLWYASGARPLCCWRHSMASSCSHTNGGLYGPYWRRACLVSLQSHSSLLLLYDYAC